MVRMELTTLTGKMLWIHGKQVTVMGLGLHGGGLAVATWLLRHGAEVTVTDLKTRQQLRPSVVALERAHVRGRGSLTFALGQHRARDFRHADLIIQNPGVPRESPYLAIARRAGVSVESEASLFLKVVRSYTPPPHAPPPGGKGGKKGFLPLPVGGGVRGGGVRITAITGTRGKSTTAALIHAMLQSAGRRAVLAGNIRIPMFSVIDEVLHAAARGPVDVVLELSSWHCEHLSTATGSVDVAVLTNLLRDHLNRYRSMRAYTAAKARLLRFQDKQAVAVCNADDPIVRAIARSFGRTVRWFASVRPSGRRWTGVYAADGTLWARDADGDHRVAPVSTLRIPGSHNIANACAAIAAARVLAVPTAAIRRALGSFRGLPGRLEVVARHNGITYMNDTCATSPDGTIAALEATRQPTLSPHPSGRGSMRGRGIILIAGGTNKNLTFDAWAKEVVESVRVLIFLPGTATEKMRTALRPFVIRHSGFVIRDARSMRDAVRQASAYAHRGSIVLLSPGAASFGLFQHEFDRGDQFTRAARELEKSKS
ncbi:UDP-N-acetylmuramoyl-L-alanine--D-glutamate ligase [Candidatus Uhrbacteria bacterium]|nr:UDP-N-acetylmuramoyl-L-alanine--D-glutamate ligase [Candidatus Uhrbacteria bacterium]